MDLREILKRQSHLRAQIAVANRVIRFLNDFIGTQARPAKDKMVADDGTEISEKEIEAFITLINDVVIAPRRQELEKLTRLDIIEEIIAYIKSNPEILPFALKKERKKTAEK